MLSIRQLILSVTKKKSLLLGIPTCNIACRYVQKFNNPIILRDLGNCNEMKNHQYNFQVLKRFKYDKKRPYEEDNVESDAEDDDEIHDKNLVTLKVGSLRTDLILKAGLSIARNKVETAFYESKIRVNGKKILKKSEQVFPGDEIDLIRGPSPENPKFLVVSRVQVMDVKKETNNIRVKLLRNKSLVIENYSDPWKVGSVES